LGIDAIDLEIRRATYRAFVELGRAPTVDVVAVATGRRRAEVQSSWLRLHDAHALVLDSGSTEIRMLNPFSAVPTAYRVYAGDRWWYANCAWDAFGICAALRTDGRIETSCADCGEELTVELHDLAPNRTDLLFHCLVPAARWWDDIVFT
jgi:hypothetical protein